MSGGSFDHNLAGIQHGQGVKWDANIGALVPADFETAVVSHGQLRATAEAVAAMTGTTSDEITGTLTAVAEAESALVGGVESPATGTLSATAEAEAALTGEASASGVLAATAEAEAALTGGGEFDPLSIGWHAAYWADDPDWTPPADGARVSDWRDASGNGRNAVNAGATNTRPFFRASVASLNNRSSVQGAVEPEESRLTAITLELTHPFTVAVVGTLEKGSAEPGDFGFMYDGANVNKRAGLRVGGDGDLRVNNGSTVVGSAIDTNPHLFISTYNSGNAVVDVDGVQDISGNAGNQNMQGIRLFNNETTSPDAAMSGHIAFFGLFDGALTAQQEADLLAWAQSYYGTP